jgi:hypothetical protein
VLGFRLANLMIKIHDVILFKFKSSIVHVFLKKIHKFVQVHTNEVCTMFERVISEVFYKSIKKAHLQSRLKIGSNEAY